MPSSSSEMLRISLMVDGAEQASHELVSFRWREEIGKLPVGEIELFYAHSHVDEAPSIDGWAGKEVHIVTGTSDRDPEQEVHYLGVVVSTRARSVRGNLTYMIEFRPKLWGATQSAACKIWDSSDNKGDWLKTTNQSVVQKVISELGLKFDISYTKQSETNYSVQYRETLYNFFMRLLEEDGAYCVYDHSVDTVKGAIITDNTGVSKEVTLRSGDTLDWHIGFSPCVASARVVGYSFHEAGVAIGGSATVTSEANLDKFFSRHHEVVEFPGDLTNATNADIAASLLAESLHTEAATFEATCYNREIFPGVKVNLDGGFGQGGKDQLDTVYVVAVEHTYSAGGHAIWFRGVSSERTYRPPRITPRPRIDGVQSAVVTNTDADTDELGRVRVKFHWDHMTESPWLRVAQNWASAEVGVFTLPQIGDEVLVAFEHGDPQRPVIIGSVWNNRNIPPVALPGDWTQTRIKTRAGHQLTFEDKPGSEYIELISGKEANLIKLDDKEEKILVDATKDYETTVANDMNTTVSNNYVLEATTKIELKVGSNSITIDTSGITVKGMKVEIKADTTAEMTASASATVSGGGMTEIKGGIVKIN